MCVKPKDKILWLIVNKDFAKQLFMATAREQNRNIGVVQFITPKAIDRKEALGKELNQVYNYGQNHMNTNLSWRI